MRARQGASTGATRSNRALRRGPLLVVIVALTAVGMSTSAPATSAAVRSLEPAPPSLGVAVEGTVYASTRFGDVVYLAGDFTSVAGEPRTSVAAVDVVTSTLLPWNPVVGYHTRPVIDSIAVDDSGSTVYFAGFFNTVGGLPRSGLAAVDTVDVGHVTPFAPGSGTGVVALAVGPGGTTLYLAGTFDTFGQLPRNHVAAVSTAGTGTVTAWQPDVTGWTVSALLVDTTGGLLYFGGGFTAVDGEIRTNLAAVPLSGNGETPAAWAPSDVPYTVTALAADSAFSTVYAGMNPNPSASAVDVKAYSTVDGTATPFSVTGTSSNNNQLVTSLALSPDDSTIYVGGRFDALNGQMRSAVAAVATSGTGSLDPWAPSLSYANSFNDVRTIQLGGSGDTLFVGGRFRSVDGVPRDSFAGIPVADDSAPTDLDVPADLPGTVTATARIGRTLFVGGDFSRVESTPRHALAAIDLDSGALTTWNPGTDGRVATLVGDPAHDLIYAGGRFSTVGGLAREALAALTPAGGVTDWDAGIAGPATVNALTLDDTAGTAYFGGWFSTVGGQTRNRLAAVATTSGSVTAWDPAGTDFPQTCALAYDPISDAVLVGGRFTALGGAPRADLAQVTAGGTGEVTAWTADIDAPGTSASACSVTALTVDEARGRVFVGGPFSTVGGQLRSGLGAIALTPDATVSDWAPVYSTSAVGAIALDQDTGAVTVGGDFNMLAFPSHRNIATFASSDASVDAWTPTLLPTTGANPLVVATVAIDPQRDALVLGGDFQVGTGSAFGGLARYDLLPRLSISRATVVEGDTGTRSARFSITLSTPSPVDVTADVATQPGTATSDDYADTNTSVIIPAGTTTRQVSVPVRGDRRDEPVETFGVEVTNVVNAEPVVTDSVGSIVDDDPGIGTRLAIGSAIIDEGDAASRSVRLDVSLSTAITAKVTASYLCSGGTATSDIDFMASAGTISIPAGSRSTSVVIRIIGDRAHEPRESLTCTLDGVTKATLWRRTGSVTIRDDDPA